MNQYACAITGHRPTRFCFGYNEEDPLCQKLKECLLEQFRILHDEKFVRTFFVGGALGVDMRAGEQLLTLKAQTGYEDIKIIVVIPFIGYDSKWPDQSRHRLKKLIQNANDSIVISHSADVSSYKKRNYYMVDHAAVSYTHLDVYKRQTKHGETDAYWLSDQANFSCKVAIEQAISTHYGDNRLDTASAVQEVMEKFGPERMNFILANTIQHKDADGRISRDNKAWAKTIPMPEDKESFRRNAYLVVDQVNPGLVDLFTRQARKTVQEKEKGSVLQKLKQELPAHKPAAPKKQGPER